MNTTIFDRILGGEIPVDPVFENDDVLAFRDINPQAPVHVLVIPKKRIERFSGLSDWDDAVAGRFIRSVSVTAEKLGLNKEGYRIVFNNGTNGGQEVEYLHAHILGGRRMTWPPG